MSQSPVCGLSRTVAMNILAARRERCWTQQELAVKTGMSQSAVGLLETGQRNVTMPVLEKMAVAFGIEPTDLLREQADGGHAPGAGPDVQHRYLLDAARSVEAFTDLHPPADGPEGELAAKALHLAACVAAVDRMCRRGDLPGDWRPGGGNAAGEAS